MTLVTNCSCQNDYQDKLYGKGKRLFNGCIKDKWRCTVCGKEVTIVGSKPANDNKKKKK
jgi:uncharacterized protein (DUF983 family)